MKKMSRNAAKTRRRMMRCAVSLAILVLLAAAVDADDQREAKVGMTQRIDQIVLPGSELEAKPLGDRQAPVVLRIGSASPHGTAFRYDLVYYGLEPGKFDLKNYLRRKDGSSTADLPSLSITIHSVLPPGQI